MLSCLGLEELVLLGQTPASVTLAWNSDSSSGVVGYNLYSGGASQTYTNVLSAGNTTNATVSGLVSGATYYFVVTAINAAGLESMPSTEVSYTVPVPNTVPVPSVVLSSPSNGASYLAPASISLTASVTPNGHTISKVQFLNGTALLGESGSAPYSFLWSNVSAGTYALSAQAVYDAGSLALSAPATVAVTGLPAPWQTLDIGAVGLPGSAAISNGLYTATGAGSLSGGSDSFRFLYQTLTADGEIRGQINSVQPAGGNGGCLGAMIRENLTSGSRYALMGISPGGGFRWQRRSNTGGGTASTKAGAATLPKVWVRVVRTGNTLYGYKSVDGVNWTLVNSSTIGMSANVYVGWAVASGSSGALVTAALTNVAVVP